MNYKLWQTGLYYFLISMGFLTVSTMRFFHLVVQSIHDCFGVDGCIHKGLKCNGVWKTGQQVNFALIDQTVLFIRIQNSKYV
jgi:hypothetical protein